MKKSNKNSFRCFKVRQHCHLPVGFQLLFLGKPGRSRRMPKPILIPAKEIEREISMRVTLPLQLER